MAAAGGERWQAGGCGRRRQRRLTNLHPRLAQQHRPRGFQCRLAELHEGGGLPTVPEVHSPSRAVAGRPVES